MDFLKAYSPQYGVNTYFFVNDDKKAVAIDVGDYELAKKYEKKYGFKITDCLLTHGHFDHAGGCAKLQKEGVKIHIHTFDADKLYTDGNMSGYFGVDFENFTADCTFNDGDILKINGFEFKVILTDGHSKGSVCFIVDDKLISGDTLFYESIGRTDFYDGNFSEIKSSLKLLMDLDKDYTVYPGHGRVTKLSHERINNPYIY